MTTTKFYHVETPSFFFETELPEDDRAWTKKDRNAWNRLASVAEHHGTVVKSSFYRVG